MLTAWYSLDSSDFGEYALVDAYWSPWSLAPYVYRLFTGLGLGIGFLLLTGLGKSKRVYSAALIYSSVLFIFQLVQLFQLKLYYCNFSLDELSRQTRFQGLILFALILLFLSFNQIRQTPGFRFKFSPLISILVIAAGIAVPFIVNYPPSWMIYGERSSVELDRKLNLERLDTSTVKNVFNVVPSDLRNGKKLICVATTSCPFCRRLAYKLHILMKQFPEAPITLILAGEEETLESFRKRTLYKNVPHFVLNNAYFDELTGGGVPKIFLVSDGVAVESLAYWALDSDFIRKNLL